MAKQDNTTQQQHDAVADATAAHNTAAASASRSMAQAAGAPLQPAPFEFEAPKAADGPPPAHEETLGALQGAPKPLADEYAKTGKTPAGADRERLVEQANRTATNAEQLPPAKP